MPTPMRCCMPDAVIQKVDQNNMKKLTTPGVAPAPPSAVKATPRPGHKIGTKTLITLSSMIITLGGWSYLSLDAAIKQADAQTVTSVESSGAALSAPEILFNPLPTIAPLQRFNAANKTQKGEMVSQQPVAQPAAAAPAPLPKPRKIHIRATTRSSR